MGTSDYGFTFNGHHSSEFGLKVLASKTATLPNKNKVTVRVPYSNGLLDLSGFYGDNSFGERTVTFPCQFQTGQINGESMYLKQTKIVNWLMSPVGKIKLTDDAMPGYYYLGEVQNAPTFTEGTVFCGVNIVFTCYPYRFRPIDNDDLWDSFNFELDDMAQEAKTDVGGNKTIKLFNLGDIPVKLLIKSSASFNISLNGNSYLIKFGDTNNEDIKLNPGTNKIDLFGSGHIEFNWVEEVI